MIERRALSTPIATAGLAAAILIILLVASFFNSGYASALITQYHDLRVARTLASTALEQMLDEETAIRGYAATDEASLLEPYARSRSGFDDNVRKLRARLVELGEPSAAAKVDRIAELELRWRHVVAEPTLRTHPPSAAASLQIQGKPIVDRFRVRLSEIVNAIDTRSDRLLATSFAQIGRVGVICLAAIIAVAIFTVAFVTYQNRVRRREAESTHDSAIARESLHRLEMLVQAIPQMVWIAGPHGEALYFNERWLSYTGKKPGNLFGARDGVIHPDDLQRSIDVWREAMERRSPYEIEYRLRAGSGEYRWFVGRGVPELDADGNIVRWFGTCTDVDDQHRGAETQIAALQHVVDAFHRAQLPQRLPSTAQIAFDAAYLPARNAEQFGGDWYDAFSFDGRRYYFSVGDVTGHGINAAVAMSRVRQTIFTLASIERDPALILERVNRLLVAGGSDMVTAVCGAIDAQTGEFSYASAGHPPGLILKRNGSVDEFGATAPPLGFSETLSIPRIHGTLAPGEMLVCYTDGLLEYGHDILEGERRLRQCIGTIDPSNASDPTIAIRNGVLGPGGFAPDDVAVLTIRRLLIASKPQDTNAA